MCKPPIIALAAFLGVHAFGALEVPGDARKGEELFRTQACVQCHSVNGKGGKVGPDLGERLGRNCTPSLLASLVWNSAPAMWSAMASRGISRPKLTTEQAADIFAYFYAARYSAQPGDAGRGRRVFESRECAGCHGVSAAKVSGVRASRVADWRSLSDPILLAQQMWNHSGQMSAALSGKKIEWPRLSSRELTDLLVYLQSLPETRGRQTRFAPASAETGKMLVQLKGCTKCHTGRLSLDNRFTNRTVADFAAAMWNHAPKMADPAPELRPEEMRRIVGYLWSLQVFDDRGSSDRGRKVFNENQCAACHGDNSSGAPKLTGSLGVSALSMVAAPWRHGPAVLQEMKKKGISWPKFEGSDMADLLAYLKTRQ